MHLHHGTVPQLSLGYLYLASIAIGRFEMADFGLEISLISQRVLDSFRSDSYTYGRGQTLHACFVGHMHTHVQDQLVVLDTAMEATVIAGDRILSLLNLGVTQAFRVWCSHDMADIESFITQVSSETFGDWRSDMRGGVFLTTVRQYARALQGKTQFRFAKSVLDDEHHSSEDYLQFLDTRASNPKRPRTVYLSYQLTALYTFGHIKEAIEVGEKLLPMMDSIW